MYQAEQSCVQVCSNVCMMQLLQLLEACQLSPCPSCQRGCKGVFEERHRPFQSLLWHRSSRNRHHPLDVVAMSGQTPCLVSYADGPIPNLRPFGTCSTTGASPWTRDDISLQILPRAPTTLGCCRSLNVEGSTHRACSRTACAAE